MLWSSIIFCFCALVILGGADEGSIPAPSNVQAIADENFSFTIKWNKITNASSVLIGYRVRYYLSSNSSAVKTKSTGNNSDEIKIDSLRPYSNYTIEVSGYTRSGNGNWSAPLTVRTKEAEPSSPPQNVITQFLCDQYKLFVSWSAIPEHSLNGVLHSYQVYLKTAEGKYINHSTASHALSTEILLDECQSYNVSVAASTKAGEGPKSDVILAVSSCLCGSPIILQPNISVVAKESEEAILPCTARGRPPINHANWMKNGILEDFSKQQTLFIQTPSERQTVFKNVSLLSNFSYYISYAEKSDSGVYTCVMSNGYGNATLTVTLTVSADFATVDFTLVLLNETYSKDLQDRNSVRFNLLEKKIRIEILRLFSPDDPYKANSVKVSRFRNGSVEADVILSVSLQNKKDEKAAENYIKTKLAKALGGDYQTLGNFSVKLLHIKGVPASPGKPRPDKITTEKITVSWSPPVYHEAYSISGYTLKYKKFGSAQFIAVDTVGPSLRSVTIEHLESGTAYEIIAVAQNDQGSSEPSDRLETRTDKTNVAVIVVSIVMVIILLILVVGAFVWWKRRQRFNLYNNNINQIDHGRSVRYTRENEYASRNNQAGPSYEDVDLNIEKNWWEIPRNSIKIEDELGSGAFGVVKKGILIVGDKTEECAVKMLKKFATQREFFDLLNELSLMAQVGDHPNIVSLIGACTVDGPLWVVVKLAENGCLLSYLQKLRSSQNYENISDPSCELTFAKKLKLACGIAKGMEHLSKKKCVHRDLAARNVLLGKGDVPMVSDFGLSRDIYESGLYESTSGGKLPVKWMPVESIEDYSYDEKSDVWAYGVTLWEIETKGIIPYAGLNGQDILKELKSGYRLEKPNGCSDEMYEIMLDCWKADPSMRPKFTELVHRTETLLGSVVGYLEVDAPVADSAVPVDTPYDEINLPEAEEY